MSTYNEHIAVRDERWRGESVTVADDADSLKQAQAELNGTHSLDEAYADYNLASTRLHLGSCDGVKDLLKTSQHIQGHRSAIDAARQQAKQQCGGGG